MDKPDVDFIEGLSPAISIDQKSASRNPRSTVGTITEVYDYLRLLYARIGVPHCPEHGARLERQTPAADRRPRWPSCPRAPASRCWRRSCGAARASTRRLLADLAGQGYVRARIDGEIVDIAEFLKGDERLARYEQHTIEIVVDRLVKRDGIERRLTDSVETALRLAEGVVEIELVPREGDEAERRDAHLQPAPGLPACGSSPSRSWRPATSRSTRPTAPARTATASAPASRSTPSWSCPTPTCRSPRAPSPRGARPARSTSSACSRPWPRPTSIDLDKPWSKLTKAQQNVLLYGAKGKVTVKYKNRYGRQRQYSTTYEGIIPFLQRRHQTPRATGRREQIEGYMREVPCPHCGGARLKPASLAVTVGDQNISEVCDLSIGESAKFLAGARAVRARPA